MDEVAIFLCDYTGKAAEPWAEAGYECWCVDVQHSIRNPKRKGNIHYVWGDARTWKPPSGKKIVFVGGFPPCTHLASSGARDFVHKGTGLLRDSLELFEACRMAGAWSGAPYFVENPVGVLGSIPHVGKPDYKFDPCDYAGYLKDPSIEAYTKKTFLWTGNNFVMPVTKRVEPRLGSKIVSLPDSKGRDKLREATPLGFSRAVYEFNKPGACREFAFG